MDRFGFGILPKTLKKIKKRKKYGRQNVETFIKTTTFDTALSTTKLAIAISRLTEPQRKGIVLTSSAWLV